MPALALASLWDSNCDVDANLLYELRSPSGKITEEKLGDIKLSAPGTFIDIRLDQGFEADAPGAYIFTVILKHGETVVRGNPCRIMVEKLPE